MNERKARELENGTISPRISAPKQSLAKVLAPAANLCAGQQERRIRMASAFWIHQPKFPKVLQEREEEAL